MKRRLFISTKEVYSPAEFPILGTNYIREDKDKKVLLQIKSPSKEGHNILVSSDEEAQWFCEVIFAILDLEDDIVIDYTTKKYYSICKSLQNVAFIHDIHKLPNNAIQQLEPEDENV